MSRKIKRVLFGTLLVLLFDVLCGSFYFISFASLSLRCNRAALALVTIAKENEGVCPSFLFPIV